MLFRLFAFFMILLVSSCGSKKQDGGSEGAELDYDTKIKMRQYIAEGRKLYEFHCANCHQVDGSGLAALFPPVKNSDYLLQDIGRSACIFKYGLEGEIEVNGRSYDQNMPANESLENLDIAEILTYILNEMNDTTVLIDTRDVRGYLENCPQN